MKKTLIVPVLLLATTPFVVSCTQKTTDLPPPPPVTGTTETVPPVVNPVQTGVVTPPVQTGTVAPVTVSRTEVLSYDSRSPEGMVPVEFSVTVTDGVITAASATAKTEKDASLYNQTSFVNALSGAVVGKKAKDLKVDAIGGASLTTAAFETFVRAF
jgi:uncharacterized protein with FMN-binding domain